MKPEIQPSALLTDAEFRVSSQSQTALEVTRDTTLGELVDRYLVWDLLGGESAPKVLRERWITVRGIVPKEELL